MESEGRSSRTPCTSREDLTLAISMNPLLSPVEPLKVDYDRERIEDIGYMTCMTLVLLGNYAQTGHFGGPLAYTPYNVALHLAGPELGGLRYDYRKPKHPFCDKFMLAGGHNIPTSYALWMIMGEAMARKHARTGDPRYHVDPQTAIVSIDALGFRRGAGALTAPAAGPWACRPSALCSGQSTWYSGPGGPRGNDRSDQRCEWRPIRDWHRHGRRQSSLLGFCGSPRVLESAGPRRRICHD